MVSINQANRMTRDCRRPATDAEARHALWILLDELGMTRQDLAGLRRAAELAGEQRDRAEAAEAPIAWRRIPHSAAGAAARAHLLCRQGQSGRPGAEVGQ